MKKLNIKRIAAIVMTALFCMSTLTACGTGTKNQTAKAANGKANVVASIFPEYDFLRQIGGDYINLSMLLTPGAESHSFEPTPQDMKTVIASDLFVYVGGDSDAWVESILDSVNTDKTHVVTLMDCVDIVEEEHVEGMMEEEEEQQDQEQENGKQSSEKQNDGVQSQKDSKEEEVEYDEHVWTSPKNAELICKKLCNELCAIDPDHKTEYEKNTEGYIEKLEKLDSEFREVVDHSTRKEIVVGDRFPFRYFVDEYGLTYYAAFPGCSTDTEASAATIAFLQDKVKNDGIPVVFHIELSNEKVCKAICEQTGAKNELLNAVHNVSKDDFNNGVTYLDLMEQNVTVLREALN